MTPHHPHGLTHDLDTLARQMSERRNALRWLAAGACASLAPLSLVACGGGSDDESGDTVSTSSDGNCSTIPRETAGPYPADGTTASNQRLNALTLSGIVRSDIRSSVGGASGTAPGVPLTVTLNLVNTSDSCNSLEGYAVYLWHCTRDGGYSMYSSGYTGENFLRGVQVSDANGQVSFSTIFPGCYSGRWPHIHFEIYASLSEAIGSNSVGDHLTVSQLALPASVCNQVYGVATGYSSSVRNFSGISLASDNVFGNDSAAQQVASVSGSVTQGFVATLEVGVAA